jgi:hypothetical protein
VGFDVRPKNDHPGRIDLDAGTIRYCFDDSVVWELPLSSVRVIGEATTDHGPFLDDYFFCFACGPDSWYAASFYSHNREEFLQSLAAQLNCPFVLRLIGSTDFASNVLWPEHLRGKPMFEYIPITPRTWLGKLIGPLKNRQYFSEEVLQELEAGA